MTTSDSEIISKYWRVDGNNGQPLGYDDTATHELVVMKRFITPPHVDPTACDNPYWSISMKEVALYDGCFSVENPDNEKVNDGDYDDGDNDVFENDEHENHHSTPRYYIFGLLHFTVYAISLSELRRGLINQLDGKDDAAVQYILHKCRFVPLTRNEFFAQNRSRAVM